MLVFCVWFLQIQFDTLIINSTFMEIFFPVYIKLNIYHFHKPCKHLCFSLFIEGLRFLAVNTETIDPMNIVKIVLVSFLNPIFLVVCFFLLFDFHKINLKWFQKNLIDCSFI